MATRKEVSNALCSAGGYVPPLTQSLDQPAVAGGFDPEPMRPDLVGGEVGFDVLQQVHEPLIHAAACTVKADRQPLERACVPINLRYELSMAINGWKERLAEAIDKDGRSLRAICQAANVGVNVLTQLFNDGKVPKITTFVALCQELKVNPLYILEGVSVDLDDVELLKIWSGASDERRKAFLAILRSE